MADSEGRPPSRPRVHWTIPTFLVLQVGLLWLLGAQLHQQNLVLVELREEIHNLADALDNEQSSEAETEDNGAVPASLFREDPPQKTAVLGSEEEEGAGPAKELQASRDTAQKAVKEAREAQSKLSISENIRKAEEAKKLDAANQGWQKWSLGAAILLGLAVLGRAFLRRRG